ncbi:MAG: hypothetical protein ACRBBR_15770 [Cellvibrionaceae bacterium]
MIYFKPLSILCFVLSLAACSGGGSGGSGNSGGGGTETNKDFTISLNSVDVSRLGDTVTVDTSGVESDSKTYRP